MSARPLLKIGDYEVPQPQKYVGTTATLVDSARNAQGYVVGSVVREDVAKVELEWGGLSASDWSSILKQFNTTHGGNFYRDCTFFNQVTNAWETRQFYVGDRTTSGAFTVDPSTGAISFYRNPKLSLVEV